MGFLETLFGCVYLNHEAKKEVEEYDRMMSGLDNIQSALDDVIDCANQIVEEKITDLINHISEKISESNYDDNAPSFYMPIFLAAFNEVVMFQGRMYNEQKDFLQRLITIYPFMFNDDNNNTHYVYSYYDAFNFDDTLKGDLRKLGEIGIDSYVWYLAYKDGFTPKIINIKGDLELSCTCFYNIPKVGKWVEYPMKNNLSERMELCESAFKMLYELELQQNNF